MKTGALILGILGGLVALSYGLIGFGLGSIADAGSPGGGFMMKLISVALPVAALVLVCWRRLQSVSILFLVSTSSA